MAGARRVAVTGLGLVNPFGGDLSDFFGRMLRGESAIRLYTREDAVTRPLAVPAVRCADFDADAALGGTLTFESGYIELLRNGRERVPPLSVVLGMSNAAASHISIQLGLGASSATYSVACASSAVAIGEVLQKIRSGEATLMVVGGSEAPLSYGVVRAWEAMRILALGDEASAARACRPFSSDRQGLVLGEGAGAMILEDWDHAVRRGARIYAEFAGCGSTSDHDHLVRPNVDGQMRAMRMAIHDGGLAPDEIDYINAHGTATREGDPIEIAAIRGVFGSRSAAVAVSATKSMHGLRLQPGQHRESPDPVCTIAMPEFFHPAGARPSQMARSQPESADSRSGLDLLSADDERDPRLSRQDQAENVYKEMLGGGTNPGVL